MAFAITALTVSVPLDCFFSLLVYFLIGNITKVDCF